MTPGLGYCPGCGKLLFAGGEKWNDHMPGCPILARDTYKPEMSLRDQLAAAALPAIYQTQTVLTDRAATLAYEQADEMLKAREPQPEGSK